MPDNGVVEHGKSAQFCSRCVDTFASGRPDRRPIQPTRGVVSRGRAPLHVLFERKSPMTSNPASSSHIRHGPRHAGRVLAAYAARRACSAAHPPCLAVTKMLHRDANRWRGTTSCITGDLQTLSRTPRKTVSRPLHWVANRHFNVKARAAEGGRVQRARQASLTDPKVSEKLTTRALLAASNIYFIVYPVL